MCPNKVCYCNSTFSLYNYHFICLSYDCSILFHCLCSLYLILPASEWLAPFAADALINEKSVKRKGETVERCSSGFAASMQQRRSSSQSVARGILSAVHYARSKLPEKWKAVARGRTDQLGNSETVLSLSSWPLRCVTDHQTAGPRCNSWPNTGRCSFISLDSCRPESRAVVGTEYLSLYPYPWGSLWEFPIPTADLPERHTHALNQRIGLPDHNVVDNIRRTLERLCWREMFECHGCRAVHRVSSIIIIIIIINRFV